MRETAVHYVPSANADPKAKFAAPSAYTRDGSPSLAGIQAAHDLEYLRQPAVVFWRDAVNWGSHYKGAHKVDMTLPDDAIVAEINRVRRLERLPPFVISHRPAPPGSRLPHPNTGGRTIRTRPGRDR